MFVTHTGDGTSNLEYVLSSTFIVTTGSVQAVSDLKAYTLIILLSVIGCTV
jgi:hypothetical protein